MDEVRWAFIGVGARGMGHFRTTLQLKNARVVAVCDPRRANLDATLAAFAEKGDKPSPDVYDGADDWLRVLARDDVDAVVISTAWEQHAAMAVAAMQAGKHAFLEVPAAISVDECWQLVDTAEATNRHCMMLENCNYGREELMLLNMVRQGVFGEILHGEAAYIHELRTHICLKMCTAEGSWRTYRYAARTGQFISYARHRAESRIAWM